MGLTLIIQAPHTYNCLKLPLWYPFLTTCWAFHWSFLHFYTIFLRFIFFKISLVGLEANLCCWLLILALNFTRKLPPNVRFFMEGNDSCCFNCVLSYRFCVSWIFSVNCVFKWGFDVCVFVDSVVKIEMCLGWYSQWNSFGFIML